MYRASSFADVIDPSSAAFVCWPALSAAAIGICFTETFDGANSSTVIGHDLAWTRIVIADSVNVSATPGNFVNHSNEATIENTTTWTTLIASARALASPTSIDHTVSAEISAFDTTNMNATTGIGTVDVIARFEPFDNSQWQVAVTWDNNAGTLRAYLTATDTSGNHHVATFAGIGYWDLGTTAPAPTDTMILNVTGTDTATRVQFYYNGAPTFVFDGTELATNLSNWGIVGSALPNTGLYGGFGIGATDILADYIIAVDNWQICAG